MYQPTEVVTSADALTEILGPCVASQAGKVIDRLDRHCRAWIARSPLVVVSSADAAGRHDVSPKGDPAGFVQVIDDHTLAIPDRKGNNRGDTFRNVLENPRIGLMFLVPGHDEVVRVSGSAQLVRDAELLDRMVVRGHRPDLALVVRVEEAFFHCPKAMIRSSLWRSEGWLRENSVPSYAEALKDHAMLAEPVSEIAKGVDRARRQGLY